MNNNKDCRVGQLTSEAGEGRGGGRGGVSSTCLLFGTFGPCRYLDLAVLGEGSLADIFFCYAFNVD